eukprot:2427098-Prymnesium_polylepis.2
MVCRHTGRHVVSCALRCTVTSSAYAVPANYKTVPANFQTNYQSTTHCAGHDCQQAPRLHACRLKTRIIT